MKNRNTTSIINLRTWTILSFIVIVLIATLLVTLRLTDSEYISIAVNISIGTFVFLTVTWWVWFLTMFRKLIVCWFRTEKNLFEIIREIKILREIVKDQKHQKDDK